jgi:hypothetical protein
MTFATDAEKSASERFFLIKFVPRMYLDYEYFRSDGGTFPNLLWYIDVGMTNLEIDNISINGSAISTNKWTYNGSIITITSELALNTEGNIVCLDYNLFITGTKTRYTSQVDSGIATAEWKPLVTQYPDFSQSMRDIAEGVFSLSNSTIEVIADQYVFPNQTLTYNFVNCPVTVWACIDSVNNNRRVFDGIISSVNYQYKVVSFNVIDTFNTLKDSAEFGPITEAYNNKTTTRTQYINAADENSAATLVIGKTSPIVVMSGARQSSNFGFLNNYFHLSDGLRAIPVTQDYETQNVVKFYLGRMIGTQLKKLTFGTVTRAYRFFVRGNYDTLDKQYNVQARDFHPVILMYLTNFNGQIGDYIPNLVAGGTTYQAYCCQNEEFYFLGELYNCAFAPTQYSWTQTANTVPAPGSVAVTLPAENTVNSISVFSEGTSDIQYQYSRPNPNDNNSSAVLNMKYSGRYLPFTLSIENSYTYGGETISHVFATVNAADIGGDLPGGLSIKSRFSPLETISHSRFMKFLSKSSGLTTNDTTFTAADSYYNGAVCFTVPEFGNSGYPTYLEIAQKVTSSVLSLLRINETRQIEYFVMKPLDGANKPIRNSVNMLQGATSSFVEFQDMVTCVKFTNPNFKETNRSNTPGYNATVDFPVNRIRYRKDVTKNIDHVLDDITGRKDFVAGYFAAPNVEYSLATASVDLASKIGDIIRIENSAIVTSNEVIAGKDYAHAMITGLDQAGSKTSVKANGNVGV